MSKIFYDQQNVNIFPKHFGKSNTVWLFLQICHKCLGQIVTCQIWKLVTKMFLLKWNPIENKTQTIYQNIIFLLYPNIKIE